MNTESFRASTQLCGEDAVRIKISRRHVHALHRVRILSRDLFQRTKQIVGKAARGGEDTKLIARRKTSFKLQFDLSHENLEPIVNSAVKRVFEKDAIERAVVFFIAIVDH